MFKKFCNKKQVKNFGLKKRERILSREDVADLFATGKRIQAGSLTIIFSPGIEQRAGFIASRKIGGAVKRNRAKRTLREAYRMHKDIFDGLHIIFLAHGYIAHADVMSAFARFRKVLGK